MDTPQLVAVSYPALTLSSFSTFELRVQTDGEVTPRTALVQSCRDLVEDLGTLSREFTKEWELRKMAGEGANAANGLNGTEK